jgi:hypothetical protein
MVRFDLQANIDRRIQVLVETRRAFAERSEKQYQVIAAQNVENWRLNRLHDHGRSLRVEVFPEDWGVVASWLTQLTGEICAVLNMANAYTPGGSFREGGAAQEENLFRRTNCCLWAEAQTDLDEDGDYREYFTQLLSAASGRVYLDRRHPRVCIRGAEDLMEEKLGYTFLSDEQIFPFFELRSAAPNIRFGRCFDKTEMRQRIDAQLETLIENDIRNVVLGAFGCGAFGNPADQVAAIYREAIAERANSFSHIAFAIHDAGYGPNNFIPFARAFGYELTGH